MTKCGGYTYFGATEPLSGTELWRTQTLHSADPVEDIRQGLKGSGPTGLTCFQDRVYFAANDGHHGTELWRSDGTQAGTHLVRDINISGSSSPTGLVSMGDFTGDLLVFSANDGTRGRELWGSDGTLRVPNGSRTSDSAAARCLRSSFRGPGNDIYFRADDGIHGRELWKTDGTQAGSEDDQGHRCIGRWRPIRLVRLGERLYFSAYDGEHGRELWKTTGRRGARLG